MIFDRYLSARNVYELRDSLNNDGFRSKAWTSSAGKEHGGVPFTHGALYHILANRVYIGETVHRGRNYPGQHSAIIALEAFEAVQQKLKSGALGSPSPSANRGHVVMLLGKLFDDSGSPMTSAHANKQNRRYLYYVSTARTQRKPAGTLPRVSAPRLEQLVTQIVTPLLDPHFALNSEGSVTTAIRRVELGRTQIAIDLDAACVSRWHFDALEEDAQSVRIERVHQLARPSTSRRLLSAGGEADEPRVDRALLRAVVQARRWQAMITSNGAASIQEIAEREGVCPIYMGQLLPLAFLAPDLIELILDGRQPSRLSLIGLIRATLPLRWNEQRALFARFA